MVAPLAGYAHCRPITLSHLNVDELQSDYVLCVCFKDDAALSDALATGYDIRFTASDGTTLLFFERDSWSGGGGSNVTAVFHVCITSVSALVDTTIYLHWGNAAATDASDPANTFATANGYLAAYHLGDGSTISLTDATANHCDLTNHSTTATTGKIGGAVHCSGSSQYLDHTGLSLSGQEVTLSAWIKPTDQLSSYGIMTVYGGGWPTTWTGVSIGLTTDFGPARLGAFGYAGAGWKYALTTYTSGEWQYVAGMFPANAEMSVHRNGVSVSGHTYPTTNISTLRIGYDQWAPSYFKGDICQPRFSITPRSAAWLKLDFWTQKDSDGSSFGSGENQLTFGSVIDAGPTFRAAWVRPQTRLLGGGVI